MYDYYLQTQFLNHDLLSLLVIEMCQVDQRLAHCLVQRHNLNILQVLLDYVSILVLNNKHLLWFRHPIDEDAPHLRRQQST